MSSADEKKIGNPRTTITVRYTRVGFHQWPDAPDHRHYLAMNHRHLFYFQVDLEVFSHGREVEFHDLLDFCKTIHSDGQCFGARSCESLASEVQHSVTTRWPGRYCRVSCFEDDEVGATVTPV